jgi:hypothetical protein
MRPLPSLPVILLIAIPATSVVLGIIMMIVAFSGPDQEIPKGQAPLSKVSWQNSRPSEELSLEKLSAEEQSAKNQPLTIRQEQIRDD